jgi:cytidylate kinase
MKTHSRPTTGIFWLPDRFRPGGCFLCHALARIVKEAKMAVITISRQYGCGGDEIADRVCELLGYRAFDKRLMAQVASEMGLSEREIVDFSEANYRVRGFMERLFGRRSARVVAEAGAWTQDASGARAVQVEQLDEEWCVRMVRTTIQAAYERGNVVIVGRGGQAVLQGKPGVLHVRLHAPLGARIIRVRYQETTGMAPEFQQRAAQDLVAERDKATAEYLQRFHQIDWADPALYHLILDTQKWGVEPAAQLVAQAVSYLPQVSLAQAA